VDDYWGSKITKLKKIKIKTYHHNIIVIFEDLTFPKFHILRNPIIQKFISISLDNIKP
jgi:hypothetical protein